MRSKLPLFPNPILYGLMALSMAANGVFIARRVSIDWHRFVHREQAVPAEHAGDHTRGRRDSSVHIVVYTDFECPFSSRFHATLAGLAATEPDVAVIYRHLPLDDLHPSAAFAAEAAECASEQGRFWEYADGLFHRAGKLDRALMPAIAAEIGLEMPRFVSCLSEGRYRQRVRADAQSFEEGHLAGTPTSFINGKRFEGELSLEALRQAVADARANGAIPLPAAPPTGS